MSVLPPLRIRVRLFAMQRETAGMKELRLEVPVGSTVDDAWSALRFRPLRPDEPFSGRLSTSVANPVQGLVGTSPEGVWTLEIRDLVFQNPDGTLRATREVPGGRGSSLFPACQNMMLAAHALGVASLFTTFFGLCADDV